MAKLLCRCGEVLWNGLIPNGIEFHAFSDVGLVEMFDQLERYEADSPHDRDQNWLDSRSEILWPPINVWRCPNCKRLYVFEDQGSSVVKYIYALEEDS